MISLKIWERPLAWHAKCSIPVSMWGPKTWLAQALYYLNQCEHTRNLGLCFISYVLCHLIFSCDAVNGNVSIGKFCSCSTVSVPKILSYDHCMMLVFKSDGSLKGAGFEAVYNSTNNNLTKADPSTNCRYGGMLYYTSVQQTSRQLFLPITLPGSQRVNYKCTAWWVLITIVSSACWFDGLGIPYFPVHKSTFWVLRITPKNQHWLI